MENEKTSSHFLTSPVCSHLLPVGPPTGQVRTAFPSHGVPVPRSLVLGVQRGCMLEGTSKGHPSRRSCCLQAREPHRWKTAYFVLKYSPIPLVVCFKVEPFSFQNVCNLEAREKGELYKKTNPGFYSFHMLFRLLSYVPGDKQGK